MTALLPNAKQQFIDGNGIPLASGSVTFYVPSTNTLKATWADMGQTIANPNPITLDANGEAVIYGAGQYRQVVRDSLGNLIWDQLTADPAYTVIAALSGTSLTSVTIGTGSKSFTTQTGLAFFPGQYLIIASAANSSNYMNGSVTSYDSVTGALVMNISVVSGSGIHADWNISISGPQGPSGFIGGVSVITANGFAGSSSGGSTPAITLTTTVTGVLKGNGTAISAATAGTDYSTGTASLATGILKSTTTTGALTIAVAGDFPTLNQNTTGNAATVTTNANLTGPITSVGNATTITNSSVTEAKLSFSNNTTANVSISAHGLAPILPNDATKFFNGVGAYTVPVANPLVGTSTTSLTIGTGTQTYTTQSGLGLGAGQFIITPSAANSANYMFGQVTSYSGTTLVLNITVVGGSGVHADWNIFISGPPGASGGSGIVNSGTANQITYYGTTGTTVSGNSNLTISTGALTVGSSGVQGSVALSGATSGTTTLAPAAVASGTLSLPAATDTLVGKATTDTLTNKTYDSAGTGNVLKLSGTTVTTASTILDIIGNTQGNILYRNASNWTVLAPGTSGQVLQSGGAAANPSWTTPSGGSATANIQTFTTSGTWTKPGGYGSNSLAFVQVWGAGGSGAAQVTTAGGGGGGGSYKSGLFLLSSLGATETATVGAGGTAVSPNSPGNGGGPSSFGTWLTAFGGSGGGDSGTSGSGGAAGGVTGTKSAGTTGAGLGGEGNGGTTGNAGNDGYYLGGGGGGNTSGLGGNSVYGGGGGGGGANVNAAAGGGTSSFGGAGGTGFGSTNGTAGTAPGGGGGASRSGTSGAGAAGQVKVITYNLS